MNSIPVTFLIVFCVAIWEQGSTNPVAMSCDSCGSECARACGTRHFRSCCFNYVRKRSSAFHPYSQNNNRFENLYRRFPYGNKEEEVKNKIDQEQKPRQNYLPSSDGNSLHDNVQERNVKNFYKEPKEVPDDVSDYEERGQASEPTELRFEN